MGSTPYRRQLRFALIDGWRDFTSAPMQEIAFEQWRQCVNAIVNGRKQVPSSRWTEIHLETFLEHPQDCTHGILNGLDIPPSSSIFTNLQELVARPVNALASLRTDKWRHENNAEIVQLLPRMVSLAKLSGYNLNIKTGNCYGEG